MFALAVHHHRGQQCELGAFRHRGDGIDHLRNRLRFERQIVCRAIRCAGAREQEPQVIVNFGDGADRGTRIVRSRFLLDRNRRRQALDQIDIGFFHQLQELPSIGGE